MLYFMENPNLKWMIWGCFPIGNSHMPHMMSIIILPIRNALLLKNFPHGLSCLMNRGVSPEKFPFFIVFDTKFLLFGHFFCQNQRINHELSTVSQISYPQYPAAVFFQAFNLVLWRSICYIPNQGPADDTELVPQCVLLKKGETSAVSVEKRCVCTWRKRMFHEFQLSWVLNIWNASCEWWSGTVWNPLVTVSLRLCDWKRIDRLGFPQISSTVCSSLAWMCIRVSMCSLLIIL